MNFMKKNKAIYIICVGFAVMFLSSSIKNVYQINFTEIANFFDLGRGKFSISATVFMLLTGVGAYISGLLSDRVGPKWTMVYGSFLIGIIFILCSFTQSFSMFTIYYGVGAALALAAIQYVPMGVLVDNHISKKHKGVVFAILTNGTGIGFAVLSPLWVYLNQDYSWQTVFFWLGLVFLAVVSGLIIFYLPKQQMESVQIDSQQNIFKWNTIFTDNKFWLLSLSFFGCGFTMAFIDVHFVPYMQDNRIDPFILASSLTVLGFVEIIGGLIAGFFSKKHPAALLSLFYAVRAFSIFMLALSDSPQLLMLFSILFGLTYLGTVILTSLICLSMYGEKIKGRIFGGIFFIHQIGAATSTSIGAYLRDFTGNYHSTIILTGAVSLLSSLLAIFLIKHKHANKRNLTTES